MLPQSRFQLSSHFEFEAKERTEAPFNNYAYTGGFQRIWDLKELSKKPQWRALYQRLEAQKHKCVVDSVIACYNAQTHCDVVLKVSYPVSVGGSHTQQRVSLWFGHKAVMSSPLQGSTLISEQLRKTPQVKEIDLECCLLTASQIHGAFRYMYEGKVQIEPSQIVPLYVLAHKLALRGTIVSELRRNVYQFLTPNHVLSFMIQSARLGVEDLLNAASEKVVLWAEKISPQMWEQCHIHEFTRLLHRAAKPTQEMQEERVGKRVSKVIAAYLTALYSSRQGRNPAMNVIRELNRFEHLDTIHEAYAGFMVVTCGKLFEHRSTEWCYAHLLLYQRAVDKIRATILYAKEESLWWKSLRGIHPLTMCFIVGKAPMLDAESIKRTVQKFRQVNNLSFGQYNCFTTKALIEMRSSPDIEDPRRFASSESDTPRPFPSDDSRHDTSFVVKDSEGSLVNYSRHGVSGGTSWVDERGVVALCTPLEAKMRSPKKEREKLSQTQDTHGVGSKNGDDLASHSWNGAKCIECGIFRHKYDFTKSQWRNRPRTFRRCKMCTGVKGTDSRLSPCDLTRNTSHKRLSRRVLDETGIYNCPY